MFIIIHIEFYVPAYISVIPKIEFNIFRSFYDECIILAKKISEKDFAFTTVDLYSHY